MQELPLHQHQRTKPERRSVPWRRAERPSHPRQQLVPELDLNVPSQGTHCSMYHILGAHLQERNGVLGARLAVWAPNAKQVSVLTNANHWTPGKNPLEPSPSGIWSGFIPGIDHGDLYKFAITTVDGQVVEKSDPFAFHTEVPPKTASIVYDLGGFSWQDEAWMRHREQVNWLEKPVAIYEVHPGSWKRPDDGRAAYNYRELAHLLVDYVKNLGYTHIQLMPVTEHPFDGSWGYQTTGYFAPTSRFGTPHDLMYFVDYCHRANIGVLIDWVPAHFPTDGHSLGGFDGTCCYEHADPRKGFHPDWGTLIFNYGRNEVRDFLLSSVHFWLDVYHIDGLRVDAVASMLYLDYSRNDGEWIPNVYGGRENLEAIQFLKDLNTTIHGTFPGVLTIAEESTAWGGVSRPVYDGGLGFSMKWDMGWMNDTLRYMHRDPIHRSHHQGDLSFRMIYAFTENFVLPLSHDEVVHGKRSLISQMAGDYWQQFANLRLLYGYQYTMPGKKLLFMGGEFAQWHEWSHLGELDWALEGHRHHDGLRQFVGDLNRFYRNYPALYETDCKPNGFCWIQCDDGDNSVFSYIRFAEDPSDFLVIACNFTPVPRDCYRLGVPRRGFYSEILNSDAEIYGGSNVGNQGGVYSEDIPSHGRDHSVAVQLPPLGMIVLKPV